MFDSVFSAPAVMEATGERAWVDAMLEVEAALARAAASAGLVPPDAAEAIASACRPGLVEPTDVWRAAAASATPVLAVVEALRAAVPAECGRYVHLGATSQDIVDSAMMLISARAVAAIQPDLVACADMLAELAATHAGTPMLGRVVMRPGRPTTFGALADGWRAGVRGGTEALRRWRPVVQLGGAVGDRADLGERGDAVAAAMAAHLGLAAVPAWHTDRTRVVELGAALGSCAGSLAKIAGDVILLGQDEIAEVSEESAAPRRPAHAVLVVACAHRTPGLIATLFAAMPQELQRAAGRWQAEWPTVTDLLRLVAGAAHHSRAMLTGLRVDAERMAGRA